MNPPTLKYKSKSQVYGFELKFESHWEEIDGLAIYDTFKPNKDYDLIQEGLGDYQVIIEVKITDKLGLYERYQEVSALAKCLDRVWMYAGGHPLTKKDFAFLSPHVKQIDGSLPGWNSNFDSVQRDLDKGKPHVEFEFKRIDHTIFLFQPLRKALCAREAYLVSSEPINTLIDLHYFSHKVEDSYSMIFFLAKGLELVRDFLPGRDDKQKEKELLLEVRENLKIPFHSIFELSNKRYESRHVYNDKKNLILHPKMSNEEIRIFKHDADLIFRSIVCSNLGIDLVIPSRE